ncbi:branched-chain amino acid ABC transporter permease [Jatrophihabitans fulvus]
MTALHAAPAGTAEPAAPARRRPPWVREFAVLAAGAVLLFLVPYVASTYLVEVGYLFLQLAALATAWNLLAGYTGMVSLGSASFVGIGVYAFAQLDSSLDGVPLPVGLLAGGVLAAGFAVVVSPAMFRLRGLYFTIGTLALAEALRLYMSTSATFGGASGIFLVTPSPEAYQLYWMVLGVAVVATAVVLVLLRRPIALRLNAVRDDETVARTMGVFTFRTKLIAFVIAGFLMGVVGAVQALDAGVVEPDGAFGLTWTVDIVTAAIIGGLGTRTGPWVGALFAVALAELLKDYATVHLAVTGAVLLLVVRFAPLGIWGSLVAAASRARARRTVSRG